MSVHILPASYAAIPEDSLRYPIVDAAAGARPARTDKSIATFDPLPVFAGSGEVRFFRAAAGFGGRVQAGDLLIADPSQAPANDKLVIVELGHTFVLRGYRTLAGRSYLAQDTGAAIEVTGAPRRHVWGVVTHVVRSVANPSDTDTE